ncbi:porin [Prosthecochloris sp. ZM_2]|uniref:porin n=1 Tax=Prosthecochloris sp. ZM_2 TaxID=2045206 RepID=UPI000DF76860|nr:porin [Prosthecochloris sp. ZM_2]RNA65114.1 porin [Prosthecochloris sp. ZM_2]
MKKKCIALLCLLAAFTMPSVASAETSQSVTFYGNLRYSFNYVDDDVSGIEGFRGTDNVSRFGIKGSYGTDDLGGLFISRSVRRRTGTLMEMALPSVSSLAVLKAVSVKSPSAA